MLSSTLRKVRNAAVLTVVSILLCSPGFAQTGTWAEATNAAPHTNSGEMLVQTDGTVLCKTSSGGSYGTVWDRLTPVNGSYKNGTWTSLPAMHYPRLYFSSQVLSDGRMYICGGEYGTGGNYGEYYSPATNTWTLTGGTGWTFPNVVSDANSEMLYNGQILQACVDETGVNWNYLWNPVTNTYTRGPNCLSIDNEAVWVKLPDSSIIFLDNYDSTSERYIPSTNTWIHDADAHENLYDPYGFEAGAGFLLPNGQVWFIGSTPNSVYYTPSGGTAPGTWTNGPSLPGDTTGGPDAAAAMMPNGHILLALSHTPYAATTAGEFPSPTYYFEFDYTTNLYTQVAAPTGGMSYNNSTYVTNMVVLPDGTVMYANQGSTHYYFYTPGSAPLAAGQPTISTVTRENCDTFQVTGTLFNGITEGAAYGDDWQMNTNFPIVRLTQGANTYYATVYNWNRIGAVMTGSLPDTAIFKLPAGLAAGTYSVTVIANGNPSAPFTINTSLTIAPSPATACTGSTVTMTDLSTGGIWTSSNTSIATVGSSTGIVTGNTTGTATISYIYNYSTGCYATQVVSVTAAPPALNGTLSDCQGAITTLSDIATGGTWSSSNTSVATVDGSGNVTGVLAGTSLISYATSASCFTTDVVTINPAPTASITPTGATTFCTGSNVVLDATTGTGFTYQWKNGGTSIGGATNATYTATLSGNYTVLVSAGLCNATSTVVTVNVESAPVVTTINGTPSICANASTTLSDGTTGGTWTSNNTSVATIDPALGTLSGVSSGTAIITYTFTNLCGSASTNKTVTINALPTVSAISGASTTCTTTNLALSDITSSGIWSSNNTAIATVSSAGIVTGASAGTAVISYSVSNAAGCTNAATSVITITTPFSASITPLGSTTFCTGGYVTLDATTGSGYTYQWQTGGVNISGATNANYTTSTSGNFVAVITNATGCTVETGSIAVTENSGSIITPAVSVSASGGDTTCSGSGPSTFTAEATNGGTTPTYEWYVNGTAVGSGATYTYSPANGDIVSCRLTSNATCAFPDTAINSIAMTVTTGVTPSVSVTSAHTDSTCVGDTVQFMAVPVYGGTAPTYLWTENGVNVATGPYYVYAPNNNDTLIVTMTSNYPCLATPFATSEMFIIHALAPTTNTLAVSVSQSSITAGSVDTFTAVATGAGSSPTFQWYINGNPVAGATGAQYITDSLKDGQIVNCRETSSFICSDPVSVFSGGIIISVSTGIQQVGTNSAHFTLVPNPNNGSFTIQGVLGSPADNKVSIIVTDVLGQTVYHKTAFANNGNVNELISLPNAIAAGTYQVGVTSGTDHVVFHVVIEK